jgi:hypothetical protein
MEFLVGTRVVRDRGVRAGVVVVVLVLSHDPRLELAPEDRTQNAVGRR